MEKKPTSASAYGKIPGEAVFAALRNNAVAMSIARPPANPATILPMVESPKEVRSTFGGQSNSSAVGSSEGRSSGLLGFSVIEDVESENIRHGDCYHDIGSVENRKIF